jgi:predicted nucleotidyltransferase
MVTKDSVEILRRLCDEGVEVIVVGMTAAIVQGVPTTTLDLDVVHRRSPENLARLLRVLRDIDAVARHDPRRIRPTEAHLAGPGHLLMETNFGDFDCLGEIDDGRGYEALFDVSIPVDFDGRELRVLALRELLAIKRRAGRPKDLAVIPYLESTIDELDRRERG